MVPSINTVLSSPRVLVVIASYGEKNMGCLRTLIRRYHSTNFAVDVVVTAEAPKTIDLGVKVIVGTPTANPFSLPFAHKKVFGDNVNRYDLFIYSEDDIGVSENSIRAFLHISEILDEDEIAGFIRYEEAADGTRTLPDVHGRFRWRPESVRRRGQFVTAEFTNEHAGFYILTNAQLKRALSSGHYLKPPYEGKYQMLESAATDVYVNCGFRKVVCISHLSDFLVHHMPNRYVHQLGIPLSMFEEQIETLLNIERGSHPAATLCEVEPKTLERDWSKCYDEAVSDDVLAMLPDRPQNVLSVGAGFGALECELHRRGVPVTALPLDSVVGAHVARRGIEVIYGTFPECVQTLRNREFECVVVTNLVHLQPRPFEFIEQCAALVAPGGRLIIEGPNPTRLPLLAMRVAGLGPYKKMRRFADGGLHLFTMDEAKRSLNAVGLEVRACRWLRCSWPRPLGALRHWPRRFSARAWILEAGRI